MKLFEDAINSSIWEDIQPNLREVNSVLHDLKLKAGMQTYSKNHARWMLAASVRPASPLIEVEGKPYTAFVLVGEYDPTKHNKKRKIKYRTFRVEYDVRGSMFAHSTHTKEQLEGISMDEGLEWVRYHAPLLYLNLVNSYVD